VKLNGAAAGRAALARTLALACAAFALLGLAAAAFLGPVALAFGAAAGALGALCAFAHDHQRRQAIALLTDSARRDPLTGLLYRRGFEEAFDAELERAGSRPTRCCARRTRRSTRRRRSAATVP
jgi:hypothetical protein